MGGGEDRESVDHLGMVHRHGPGDRSTPIVTNQPRRVGTELTYETSDVVSEQVDGVVLEVLWLRGQVVAPRIGRHDAKTGLRKGLDLQPPAKPALREAMLQNDQRPIAGLDVVQAHVSDLGVALLKLDPDVRQLSRLSHQALLEWGTWMRAYACQAEEATTSPKRRFPCKAAV